MPLASVIDKRKVLLVNPFGIILRIDYRIEFFFYKRALLILIAYTTYLQNTIREIERLIIAILIGIIV